MEVLFIVILNVIVDVIKLVLFFFRGWDGKSIFFFLIWFMFKFWIFLVCWFFDIEFWFFDFVKN